jgi:hypothetical protein
VSRAAGRDAVVYDEYDPATDVERRSSLAEALDPLLYLGPLLRDEVAKLLLGDADELHCLAVHPDRIVLGDSADAELWLERRPDFPDDADIERSVERTRDLVRNRNSSAREPKDDRRLVGIPSEVAGQLLTCVAPVAEKLFAEYPRTHDGLSFNFDTG